MAEMNIVRSQSRGGRGWGGREGKKSEEVKDREMKREKRLGEANEWNYVGVGKVTKSMGTSLTADSRYIILGWPPALSLKYTVHKAPADGHNKMHHDQQLCTSVCVDVFAHYSRYLAWTHKNMPAFIDTCPAGIPVIYDILYVWWHCVSSSNPSQRCKPIDQLVSEECGCQLMQQVDISRMFWLHCAPLQLHSHLCTSSVVFWDLNLSSMCPFYSCGHFSKENDNFAAKLSNGAKKPITARKCRAMCNYCIVYRPNVHVFLGFCSATLLYFAYNTFLLNNTVF